MSSTTKRAAVLLAASAIAAVLPGAGAVAAEKDPAGDLVICNHSGYMFDVYADGPEARTDDLAGSFDECTDWAPLKPGSYQIGFSLRIPSQQNVIIQARFKRAGHTYYKVFNGQGVLSGVVADGKTTRVDLFIPRA
ncbi:MAG: hypothetical protein ACT4QF_20795 [Sporichthyaceae bacterium]